MRDDEPPWSRDVPMPAPPAGQHPDVTARLRGTSELALARVAPLAPARVLQRHGWFRAMLESLGRFFRVRDADHGAPCRLCPTCKGPLGITDAQLYSVTGGTPAPFATTDMCFPCDVRRPMVMVHERRMELSIARVDGKPTILMTERRHGASPEDMEAAERAMRRAGLYEPAPTLVPGPGEKQRR